MAHDPVQGVVHANRPRVAASASRVAWRLANSRLGEDPREPPAEPTAQATPSQSTATTNFMIISFRKNQDTSTSATQASPKSWSSSWRSAVSR